MFKLKWLISAILIFSVVFTASLIFVNAADEDVHTHEIMPLSTTFCQQCKAEYGYTVGYTEWNESQHFVRQWCDNCGLDQLGGSVSEPHTMSGGVCTLCGYSDGSGDTTEAPETECSHSSTYKTTSGCKWYKYCSDCGERVGSGTTHGSTYTEWDGCDWKRYCYDCGAMTDSGTTHSSYSYSSWTYYSILRHKRTSSCTRCGDSSVSYGYHSTTTKYSQYSEDQHIKGKYCSSCSSYVGSTSYEAHNDSNGDSVCDSCGYTFSVFSVTIPSSLDLTVSEDGKVFSSSEASIQNNSTGAVKVTSVTVKTVNGWTLVPYSTDMSGEKVDSKLIGFCINNSASTANGTSEKLSLNGGWSISKGSSLSLSYDAVISAYSTPITEQVLNIVFVLDWTS